LWGAPRIHGELLKLGIQIAQSTVAKYMVRRRGPPSRSWKTFIRNHTPYRYVCRADYRLQAALWPGDHEASPTPMVWINVTANPKAEWIARQIAVMTNLLL
jgi:hypothetical protein